MWCQGVVTRENDLAVIGIIRICGKLLPRIAAVSAWGSLTLRRKPFTVNVLSFALTHPTA